eukprot:CAMPEP_0115420490 /NCGR_PEP_ID=MMETSP0271-20121206/25752_1 /TAXON_ID=71861 /ORGANISM="Scrippsiella trochoidea, Strain CCMP3099" /LENGTH=50 /DNA_ID=CAMNT_0002845081 /DNA_START=118 /DNA_END=267 /DNA_ORIENTATION=-
MTAAAATLRIDRRAISSWNERCADQVKTAGLGVAGPARRRRRSLSKNCLS